MPCDAEAMREALRRRHPAIDRAYVGGPPFLGAWSCLSELWGIDLLAISATKSPARGAQKKTSHPRVGYEIKVSRSDFRRELLEPRKRAAAIELCHEFYFAVPQGLLKPAELEYAEPQWDHPGDFLRTRCDAGCREAGRVWLADENHGFKKRTRIAPRSPENVENGDDELLHFTSAMRDASEWQVCERCAGRGYSAKSRVEREAPTLWVPSDVGLIEALPSGSHRVVKKSPVRPARDLTLAEVGDLTRWVSARPDPRHAGVVDELRRHMKRQRDMLKAHYP